MFKDNSRDIFRIQAVDLKREKNNKRDEESDIRFEQNAKRPASARINQRLTMDAAVRFASAIMDALNSGFKNKYEFPLAAAIKTMLQQPFIGTQHQTAHYSEMLMRQCRDNALGQVKLMVSERGIANLKWQPANHVVYMNQFNQLVYLLLYNDTTGKVLYADKVANCLDREVTFECTRAEHQDNLYGWIFLKQDGKNALIKEEAWR